MEQGVSFGRHRFDLDTGCLWSGKREVKLTPKASAVLKALVTHAGQPVRKEELFASVWNGTVVSDDALTSCIQELRRALGDDAKRPRFIETRHRRGYQFIAPLSEGAVMTASGSSLLTPEAVLRRPAVAILPFMNLSGDETQEYFADGITEDLITSLAHWRWFPVIARNSTFAYKGRAVDVTQVGRELNARYVVEGSLRRASGRVRINAKLIDANSGHHLWAQTYERHLGDIFELQDELTRAIAIAIEPQITHAEQQRAARKRPGSLDAWDLSLQALAQIQKGSVQALAEAKKLLRSATSMDSTSSYAQSLLALAEFHDALAGWGRDPASALAETLSAAEAAVELDDNDWLAHTLRGIATLWVRRAYESAVREEELALALNPSASLAHHCLGCALTFAGRPLEAIPRFRAVLDIDPRFPLLTVTLADLGLAKLLTGGLTDSLDLLNRALAEQAGNVRAWQRKVVALAHLGRIDEAQAALARLLKLQPSFSAGYVATTYPFRHATHTAVFVDGLRKAGWAE